MKLSVQMMTNKNKIIMASILLVLTCLENACKYANKGLKSPALNALVNEISLAKKSSAGQHLKAQAVQKKLNGIKSKLSHSEQVMLQDSVSQSFSAQGLMLPFDEQGNLNVHFDDFLNACDSIEESADIGSALIDSENVVDTISDTVDAVPDSLDVDMDAAADIAESVAEKAESLWDFISSFFD